MVSYLAVGVIAGLAAAPHCAGMCGAFPLHLSRAAGEGRPLARHLLYLMGKTLTYVFLGALAGLLGEAVVKSRFASSSQQLLAYLLGAAMVLFGLTMLGAFRSLRLPAVEGVESGFLRQLCRAFLQSPGRGAGFLLGVATGFLPCPITFGLLLVAAATGAVLPAMLTMAGLGLGTSAVLLGMGLSGTLVDRRVQRIGLRGAALIVIVAGLIVMLRPTGLLCRVLPHPTQLGAEMAAPR